MIKKVDQEKIHQDVVELSNEHGIDHIDAILLYCEMNNYEIETIGHIIRRSTILKSKVQDDANKLNMLEKTTENVLC